MSDYVPSTEVVSFIDGQGRVLDRVDGGQPFIASDSFAACRLLVALRDGDEVALYRLLRSSAALPLLKGLAVIALAFGDAAYGGQFPEVLAGLADDPVLDDIDAGPVRTYRTPGDTHRPS